MYDTRRMHGTWSSAPARVNMVALAAEIKELFTRQKRYGCRGSFTRTAQHGSLPRKDLFGKPPSREPATERQHGMLVSCVADELRCARGGAPMQGTQELGLDESAAGKASLATTAYRSFLGHSRSEPVT